jgi:CO dehydrogenase/acetyl-CoA synthase epsilon subunit
MNQNKRAKNFDKVREIIKEMKYKSFTNYDLVKITGLHSYQIKKILLGILELGEIKYIESCRMFIKTKKNNIETSNQINNNIKIDKIGEHINAS